MAIGIAGILFYDKAPDGSPAIPEVRAITETLEYLSYESLRGPCGVELAQLCRTASTPAQIGACLIKNRDSVSPACEVAIRNQFGGKPFQEPTIFRNVLLPVGSSFFYDDHGELLGAITTGPTRSRGIEYKAGQIYFNQNGISVGELTHDQTFNGIKYAANGISLFLYDNDQVETAILAEDTSIQGRTYKGGTQIHFYPSGKVLMGHLADTGDFVVYNEDGSRQPTQPTIRPFDFVLVDSSATKPLCATGAVPTFECLPERFANLPPDPGERGKQTLRGIDADGDGLRDDVQRFIVLNWGFSERAVAALGAIARAAQKQVEIGGNMSRDEAYALVKDGNAVTCYSRSVDQRIAYSGALKKVIKQVKNTPERAIRLNDFDSLLSGREFVLNEAPIKDLCGYDPAALPN